MTKKRQLVDSLKKYPCIIYVKNCLKCEFQILHLNKTKIISALTLKFSKWGESMLLPKDMSNNFTKTIFSLNEYSRHYSG